MRTGYKAITGMDLPPDIGPPYPGTIEEMANFVFERPEARFRHPPRIEAYRTSWPTVDEVIAPAPCVRWYLRMREPPKFFPVTVEIQGTGKTTTDDAFLWMKFFPFNHEVKDPFEDHQDPPYDESYQRWRVFTGSWGDRPGGGGAVTHCVLVEVWQDPDTQTLYGCMQPFDPGWPYYRMGHWYTEHDDPPPPFLGWNDVNFMSRPWEVLRVNHPNVCRVEMPDAATTGVFLVNLVVNPFYQQESGGQESCVILMGGSYLESGQYNNGSWVHLERTMKKIDLRWEGDDRNVFDRPKKFDPQALPGGRVILRPALQTVNRELIF